MQERHKASLLVVSIELFCIIMMLSATLLAMEPQNIAKEHYERELLCCKKSIIDNIEQYILVLPMELGCKPCQILHWFVNSYKAQHIEGRRKQLDKLKSQLAENVLCIYDVQKYLENVMGEFSGEYGQKFKQICLDMVERVSQYFNDYKSLLINYGNEDGFFLTCVLCNESEAEQHYSCGHTVTCKKCEGKRLYKHCLSCASSITENLASALTEAENLLCQVCFDNPFNMVLMPCGHSQFCDGCTPNFEVCPICKSAINNTLKRDSENCRDICGMCNKANSDVVLSCMHISICQECQNDSLNSCGICQQPCSKKLAVIYK